MQNSERQPFDESWRSAFDGAEMSPPSSLWKNIEVELAGDETNLMRRRVAFYQRIAAATVLFAVVSGAVAVYNYRGNTELASGNVKTPGLQQQSVQSLAPQSSTGASSSLPSSSQLSTPGQPTAVTDGSNQVHAKVSEQASAKSTNTAFRKGDADNSATNTESGDLLVATAPPTAVADHHDDNTLAEEKVMADDRQVAGNENTEETKVTSPSEPEETAVVELLSAEQINAIAEAKDKEEKTKVESHRSPWLGVNGAAGSYTPSASVGFAQADAMSAAPGSGSGALYASSQNAPSSYRHSVGSAYSAGVSGGIKVSRRWVVQSGINYISQQVDYTTNFVGLTSANKATAMTYEFQDNSNLDVAVTSPYEVSNTMEVLSVPLQAGFLVVDRKLGWQLNTGVSTDVFLRSTLSDKSGSREKISEGGGEGSPYRSVNWSGLLNTEVSYRIGDHYRLAIVPGLRYAFQPMFKDQSGGTPLVLDVGFRFNYLFN